ncbi:MAG TPA: hypothetical protein VF221_15050 [Chloroflexota bacterium]
MDIIRAPIRHEVGATDARCHQSGVEHVIVPSSAYLAAGVPIGPQVLNAIRGQERPSGVGGNQVYSGR